MTPNPNDLEMQRNNAHRAASARPTSMVMSNHNSGNDHTVLRVSGNASDAVSSGSGTLNHLRYADLNHLGNPSGPPNSGIDARHTVHPGDVQRGHHGHRKHHRAPDALPPYRPRVVEAFTAAIAAALVAGVVACACAFPYQAVLDRKADARRWEVSLARWGAARDDPVYPPIARFATLPASDGVDAYVVARREDEDVDDANERYE